MSRDVITDEAWELIRDVTQATQLCSALSDDPRTLFEVAVSPSSVLNLVALSLGVTAVVVIVTTLLLDRVDTRAGVDIMGTRPRLCGLGSLMPGLGS